MRNKFTIVACALAILLAPFIPVSARNPSRAAAATSAQAECVVEITSKRVLHAVNAETNLPMASTTKILTAILIIDDCDLKETVTIPKEAEGDREVSFKSQPSR